MWRGRAALVGRFFVLALFTAGCTGDNNETVTIPTVTTLANELESTTSLTGGTIAVEIETELPTATDADASPETETETETSANPDDPTGSSTGTTTTGGDTTTTGGDTTTTGGDTTVGSTVAPGSTAGASVPATGPLTVTLPSGGGLPQVSGYEVVTSGSGPIVDTGDMVWIHYEMVSWSNGNVVESTALNFGEPLILVIGDGSVPRILEAAVFQKPVGSRLLVVFEEALVDLPTGFEPGEAYALAVDIVGP